MRVLVPIGKTNPHAARLRRESTEAEQRLWKQLRNRQVAGLKFRRQATIGPYVADFMSVDAKLIVEADGGQHSPDVDARRDAFLAGRGFRVMRFWNNEILENLEGVLQMIALAAEEQKKEPSPNPLLRAGEGNLSGPLLLAGEEKA